MAISLEDYMKEENEEYERVTQASKASVQSKLDKSILEPELEDDGSYKRKKAKGKSKKST